MKATRKAGGLEMQIETAALARALARLKPVLDKDTTLPAQSCALFDGKKTAEGGRVTVSGYDLEVGLTSTVASEIRSPGALAVPAKLLRQIVEGAPENVVELVALENHRLRLRSGDMECEIAGVNPDECPTVSVPDRMKFHPVDTNALRELIEATEAAMGQDGSRENLCGCLLERTVEGWRMVATDGHQLSLIDRHIEDKDAKAVDGRVFLGAKPLAVLKRILTDEEAVTGELGFTKNAVAFRREGLEIVSRLTEDKFPEYREVIPERGDVLHSIDVSRGQLRRAIERLLPIANKQHHHVVMALNRNRLRLRAESADFGYITETMIVEYSGPSLVLAASSTYLLNALGSLGAEFVSIELCDQHSPIVVRPKDSKLQTYLVMPRQIEEAEADAILNEELADVFPTWREEFAEQARKLRALDEVRHAAKLAGKAAQKANGGPLKVSPKGWPAGGDWSAFEKELGRELPADERRAAVESYWAAASKTKTETAPVAEDLVRARREGREHGEGFLQKLGGKRTPWTEGCWPMEGFWALCAEKWGRALTGREQEAMIAAYREACSLPADESAPSKEHLDEATELGRKAGKDAVALDGRHGIPTAAALEAVERETIPGVEKDVGRTFTTAERQAFLTGYRDEVEGKTPEKGAAPAKAEKPARGSKKARGAKKREGRAEA